ncbi:hypothetical protein FNV43_RR09075 [Rhamnella rubrinervis]|uniref:Hydrophobic seed protein domain-containing protein n=1 Tax=Rhamnella rubrinervis TaxID=2594499 RepID=A0A8K0H9G5_9ROSA|nr:hypothetical protein FNV43_RR09075 [Rhamnella rubrinervis]
MASKTLASTALLLSLNILFFTMVSSTYVPCPPLPQAPSTPPPPKVPSTPPPPKAPSTPPPPKAPSTPPPPKAPSTPPPPKAPSTPTPPKAPSTPPSPKAPSTPQPPKAPSPPPPPKAPSAASTCPKDALKIGACVNVLKGELVHLVLGKPPSSPDCCPLIEGLADLEAAVCLCTTIRLNVLNLVNLNIPIDLSLILSNCHKEVPSGYKCA